MFSFAYPHILWFLLLVPIFWGVYIFSRYLRLKNLKKFGDPQILSSLMPDVSPYKPSIKITLSLLALTMIILAAARPWGGVKDQKTVKEGIEVVIAVDASNSMLASSTSDNNGVSRMRQAKVILEKLINRLDNDRVGLIVYAGDAYTLIPVTSDYVSAKMFLNSIDPSQFKNQGSNIAAAINSAVSSFKGNKSTGKAIILITDAEELEDQEGVMKAAASAAKDNIQIDVVGLGSTSPVTIPYEGGLLQNPMTGKPVETALNEELASKIASAGKGIYVNAANSDALNELEKQLDTVKKSKLASSMYAVHDELFNIFVWAALALIVLNLFVLDGKIKWLDRFTFFKNEEV